MATAPVLLWAADRSGTLLVVEGNGSRLAGLPSEAVEGRQLQTVFHDVPELLDQFHAALRGESTSRAVQLQPDLVMDCWAGPLRGPAGEVTGVVGLAVDVTARHRAQRRLLADWRRTEGSLRSHEQDRRLISHEIHDGLVQEATAAQMRLEALIRSGQVTSEPVKRELELVLGLVHGTIQEARQLVLGLRPPVLEERGLTEALRHLAERQGPGGPSVELAVSGEFPRLEPLLENAVYRIVQEALNNVRRHSQSDRAEVRVSRLADRVVIEVRDRGVGFDPACVDEACFGLKGIRQRARVLHGRAEIDSAPGKGTRVLVDLPLAQASQDIPLE